MPTTLTICRGCLRHAEDEGAGARYQSKIADLQERIERQLGPVELQMVDCLHHCLSHEVCVRLEGPTRARPSCAHLKHEPSFRDPVAVLLGS